MLLSIPGKVLTRIILERLKTALDKRLRVEQAGFRQDRSCTDHIATMHIIIEQSLEWQTPLYTVFVDFQKALDIVDRDVIWRLMSHYGFPPKFVAIIQQLYEDATCQVIHDGKPCTTDHWIILVQTCGPKSHDCISSQMRIAVPIEFFILR